MKPAAQRRPSPVHPRPALPSTAPSTVALRFVPGVETPACRPRSVQLARTCGRFRCVSFLGQHHCAARQPGQPGHDARHHLVVSRVAAGGRPGRGSGVRSAPATARHLAASYAYFRTFHRDVEDTIRNRGTPLAMPV